MVELREINDSNRAECCLLKVSDEQKEYIAPNESSLMEAEENKEVARPFAICIDNKIVGFTMLAFDEEYQDPDDRYWLWRFMIDENCQGRGYGGLALKEIIGYFKSHGANNITLSTKESNQRAIGLYHKFGFRETGQMNEEEAVLRLTF